MSIDIGITLAWTTIAVACIWGFVKVVILIVENEM